MKKEIAYSSYEVYTRLSAISFRNENVIELTDDGAKE